MKNQPLMAVLIVALIINAVLAPIFTYVFIQRTRELNMLKLQANQVTRDQQMLQALAAEAMEYSKKNSAIDPILQSVGLKPKPTASATAAKPAVK